MNESSIGSQRHLAILLFMNLSKKTPNISMLWERLSGTCFDSRVNWSYSLPYVTHAVAGKSNKEAQTRQQLDRGGFERQDRPTQWLQTLTSWIQRPGQSLSDINRRSSALPLAFVAIFCAEPEGSQRVSSPMASPMPTTES